MWIGIALILIGLLGMVGLAIKSAWRVVNERNRQTAEAYEESYQEMTTPDKETIECWEKLGDACKKAGTSAVDFGKAYGDISAKSLYRMNDNDELELVNIQIKEGCYVEDDNENQN